MTHSTGLLPEIKSHPKFWLVSDGTRCVYVEADTGDQAINKVQELGSRVSLDLRAHHIGHKLHKDETMEAIATTRDPVPHREDWDWLNDGGLR